MCIYIYIYIYMYIHEPMCKYPPQCCLTMFELTLANWIDPARALGPRLLRPLGDARWGEATCYVMYTHMCVYIYIYLFSSLSLSIYIYIHTCTHTHTYGIANNIIIIIIMMIIIISSSSSSSSSKTSNSITLSLVSRLLPHSWCAFTYTRMLSIRVRVCCPSVLSRLS